MSIIYALVGTNRVLKLSNSNNYIVIGDFNSFLFWDTLYICTDFWTLLVPLFQSHFVVCLVCTNYCSIFLPFFLPSFLPSNLKDQSVGGLYIFFYFCNISLYKCNSGQGISMQNSKSYCCAVGLLSILKRKLHMLMPWHFILLQSTNVRLSDIFIICTNSCTGQGKSITNF
jgi:hypothetical protein